MVGDMGIIAGRAQSISGLRDALLNILANEQTRRPSRSAKVLRYDGNGEEAEWEAMERLAMLSAVNRARRLFESSAVQLADIERAETMACGHSDYPSKFALYCAELAHGLEMRP